jgi:hypothetical protein
LILYHGTNNGEIDTLIPMQADHDRPYIYLTENEVVASFYIINCVERPFYWFPYGFTKDHIPEYDELYPNALQEACEGKKGFVYSVDINQETLLPFKNIPGAWLSTVPLQVINKKEISHPYSWFLECEKASRLVISRYEDKSERELLRWNTLILEYISEKKMIETPGCSYAKFVREKFPQVWKNYEDLESGRW